MKKKDNMFGNLGDADGFSDVGEVDMFGLDEFGEPAGGDSMWGAVIGGGVGTGAAIIARAMTSPTSKIHKFSELTGLLAGGVAGGVMMAFPGTRRMGWAAVATAFVTNGLRQLETSLFPPKLDAAAATVQAQQAAASPTGTAPTPTADQVQKAAAGWGGVTIDPTAVIQPGQGYGQGYGNGFGIATIEPGYVVPANLPSMMNGGFGAATIEPAYPVPGSIHGGGGGGFGMDRPDLVGPPTLVGAGDYGMSNDPAVTQTKILGGPNVSSMGMHFGATLFGGSN
jgi:hypothetical protein